MAYAVKKLAMISGVSVRALHYYDEAGLLKPAYYAANGYRYYEEPQLPALQQILFYRELGFELKQIQRILNRTDFEKMVALKSHREVLQRNLARTRQLLGSAKHHPAALRVVATILETNSCIVRGSQPVDCRFRTAAGLHGSSSGAS